MEENVDTEAQNIMRGYLKVTESAKPFLPQEEDTGSAT